MRGPLVRGGRYELRNASMVDLVRTAYHADADKVVGGPSWLEMDRFDVVAKMTGKPSADEQRNMLRTLLADRFKLVVHNETQSMPAYALTAGKHPALKKADAAGNTGCKFNMQAPQGAGPGSAPAPAVPMIQYACRNVTMSAFANQLRQMVMAQQYLRSVPILDKTGLEGAWDFDMKYSMRVLFPGQGDLTSLPDALEKQLGLKLEIVKESMPVLVVDGVNQKPSPDPPAAEEAVKTASPPTEFEVADVKLSNPDSRGMRFQIQPTRVNLTGMTLKALIQQAWSISEDMIVGAPKWLDSDRFDIIAKVPSAPAADPSAGPANGPVDIDTVWIMFRSLLKERFKLEYHNEERPVPAYTLLAVNPKIKKADPASRTRLVEEPATDTKNGSSMSTHVFTVQNMTMAQFAAQLRRVAPAVIHVPVLDATGLEGSYSFTFTFTGAGMALPAGAVRPPGMNGMDGGPASEASDPTGAITLPQALEKLGLKLELQKRTMSVLVIDRVERTPTEN
jgi:uncharacterized protein (TIGR03435 family)